MSQPLVSIIVPCYNQAQFLSEALESVLHQTYTHWECIIINDGSTDHTDKVANNWCNKDDRFTYITIENGGLCSARNIGIEKATGKYILPLDADDRIGSKYLELAIEQFLTNNKLKVVYCKAKKFGEVEGDWNLKTFTLKDLAKENMIFCTAFFKKEDWTSVGGYDVNMIYGFEDWEFWINILKDGGEVCQLPEVCFFYRISKNSMYKSLDSNKQKHLYNYLSLKHTSFFIEQLSSFIELKQDNLKIEKKLNKQINSKKNAVNVLFKTFFGIKIFK